MEVHTAEGTSTNKQRLEVLEEQEELIEDENKQEASAKETIGGASKVKDDIILDDKEEAKAADAEVEHIKEAAEAAQAEQDAEKAKKEDTKT